MVTRVLATFIQVLIFLFFQLTPAVGSELRTVLLLHSYHAGYKWTDDISSAVQNEVFGKNIDLRIEHLDTKRYFSPDYLDSQRKYIADKYSETRFDAVLLSDNHALQFALDFRGQLFPDIPIVFCGVNSFEPKILRGQNNITGINEQAGIRKTFDLMMAIHPKTKRLIVVNDESVTASILKQTFIEEARGLYPDVERVYTENYSAEDLIDLLRSLSANDLVLLGLFFHDINDRQFEYFETATLVSQNSPVPVYALYDFYLNHGILGGHFINGALQGQVAAKLLLDILSGTPADSLPVIMKSPNQYFADYKVLQKFGISEDTFPQQTVFINKSPDFYSEYKLAIWITGIFLSFFILLSLLLSINVMKKKKAEATLRQLTLELSDRVDERTRELSVAGKEMKRKEEQLTHLLSNLSGMVYRCEKAEHWSMLYVSDGCQALTGYLPEELIKNKLVSYAQLIDPRDRDNVSSIVADAIESKKHFTIEYRITTKNNKIKWVWQQGLAVYDKEGNCLYIDGIITDITERKKNEEEQTRLITAVEQTDDLVIITNTKGSILYVNPAFERVTGYSLGEVKGRNPRILKSGHQDEDYYRNLWGELTSGNVWRGKFINRKKDGDNYIAEVTISPIRDKQGDLINYIGVQRDITHEVELEKNLRQAQKLEAMGTLAGGIAHEINTPAQFVSTNLEFLSESLPDLADCIAELTDAAGKDSSEDIYEKYDIEYLLEELPLAVQQSTQGISQISNIVRSMKQFAHPGEDAKTNMDLNDALKNTATVCRNEWKYCADMTFDLDDNLPMVPCHRSEINQVFLNIIVNAAHAIANHHGESGEQGKIDIRTRQDEDMVEIAISDNGIGVPDEVKERIFDPFFTTKEPGKGTGQGLSIAHSIVTEKHGGTLIVSSHKGQGSTFTIRLPLA